MCDVREFLRVSWGERHILNNMKWTTWGAGLIRNWPWKWREDMVKEWDYYYNVFIFNTIPPPPTRQNPFLFYKVHFSIVGICKRRLKENTWGNRVIHLNMILYNGRQSKIRITGRLVTIIKRNNFLLVVWSSHYLRYGYLSYKIQVIVRLSNRLQGCSEKILVWEKELVAVTYFFIANF